MIPASGKKDTLSSDRDRWKRSLSGKIEDSRELFDEAAGIAKYKKNRSVTEKVPGAGTAESGESDGRSAGAGGDGSVPWRNRASTAKEYLKLRDREKELDIHLFLYDYEHTQEELKENGNRLEIVEKDLEETRQTHDKIKEKNASLQQESESLLARIDETETERANLSSRKEELDSQNMLLGHKMESNQRMIAHYEEIIGQNLEEKESKIAKRKEQQEQLAGQQEKISALEEEKARLTEEKEQLTGQKQLAAEKLSIQKDAIFSMMDDQLDTKEKLSRYDTMEEQLLIRNAEYNSRLIALQSDLKEYNGKTARLETSLEETQKEYDEALAALEALQEKERMLSGEEQRLNTALEQENQDFLRARSRYETLAGFTERYEGYNQSIKHIMEQKKEESGHHRRGGRHSWTLDKKYETAIEIALGGALQNVVTEDDQVAKKMIAFLKAEPVRPGHFPAAHQYPPANTAVYIRPFLRRRESSVIASDLVTRGRPGLSRWCSSLLGRTIVVDTIENASALIQKK